MSATQNGLASRDNWRADHRVVPKMPAPLAPSSRATVEGSRGSSLKITQRDPSLRAGVAFSVLMTTNSSRAMHAAWRRPGQIFPSSNYLDQADARALFESPSLKPHRPPIQSSPDQPTSLQRPARDYKNRSRPERHRGWRTRRCSGRSRGIDSTAGHRARHSAILPLGFATRFDIANDKDAADRRA